MVIFPNAKINIGLNIIEKRSDGFHNLTSCFYPVGWCDALEILPSSTLSFESSGLPIPGDSSNNLCLKAYQLLAQEYSLPMVSIHLLKSVPIGAGLGGGSADAAFTIKALSELFSLNMSVAKQQDYARKLGSDCAFFIENKPNFCFGKGDEFEQINVCLTGMHLVLVHPGIHISTAKAYAEIRPKQPAHDLRELLQQPIDQWRTGVINDFEEALFPGYPLLSDIKAELYKRGAVYASMSGSGSTLYGIFRDAPDLSNNFRDFTVWQGELT